MTQPQAQAQPQLQAQAQARTVTILVADDEQDIRELVAYRLSRSGYSIIEARDGEEAFQLAADQALDMAVLDVMMPRLNGLPAEALQLPTVRCIAMRLAARVLARTVRCGASSVAAGTGWPCSLAISKPTACLPT